MNSITAAFRKKLEDSSGQLSTPSMSRPRTAHEVEVIRHLPPRPVVALPGRSNHRSYRFKPRDVSRGPVAGRSRGRLNLALASGCVAGLVMGYCLPHLGQVSAGARGIQREVASAPSGTLNTGPQPAAAAPMTAIDSPRIGPGVQEEPYSQAPAVLGPTRPEPVAPRDFPPAPALADPSLPIIEEVLYEATPLPGSGTETYRLRSRARPGNGSGVMHPVSPERDAAAPIGDATEPLRVEGIFWDRVRPLALINDKIVEIGSEIEGAKVVAIEPTSVTLNENGRERVIQP